MAQSTAQLTVSINVQSSIQLIFKDNALKGQVGYCPLSNPNTNNVGLNLGAAWIAGVQNSSPCALYAGTGNAKYQVSSSFDVWVTKANTSSPNYSLAAKISSAPPQWVTWMVNGATLNNTSFTALDGSDTYNAAVTKSLQVAVGRNAAGQTLQETITFLATAN